MAIHHDKALYGRLQSMQTSLSDVDLSAMVTALNAEFPDVEESAAEKPLAASSAQSADLSATPCSAANKAAERSYDLSTDPSDTSALADVKLEKRQSEKTTR